MKSTWSILWVLAFSAFLLWIIFQANTGASRVLFDLVRLVPFGDKIGHMVLFGSLAFIAIVASRYKTMTLVKLKVFVGALVVSILVLIEEISQAWIPSRTFDVNDLVFDAIGIGLAICLARYCDAKQQACK